MPRPAAPTAGAASSGEVRTVRVWDPPVRLFHWSLVVLVAVNLYTGLTGGLSGMDIHMASGYAILALVLFRLVWGAIGSRHARFSDFVRGPRTVAAYARKLLSGAPSSSRGHNPLGGWSVMALLTTLLIQAATGLFTRDDIFVEGPLVKAVSPAVSDWMSWLHNLNSTLIMVLIAVHLGAIAYYHLVRRENLVRAMITGRKMVSDAHACADEAGPESAGPDPAGPGYAPSWLAAAVLAAAAGVVWLIVGG